MTSQNRAVQHEKIAHHKKSRHLYVSFRRKMAKRAKRCEILTFQHGDEIIPYTVTYSRRRSLGISVSRDLQVEAKVPLRSSLEDIQRLMQEKSAWISKHLNRFREMELFDTSYLVESGFRFFYLGQPYTLEVVSSEKNEIYRHDKFFMVCVKDEEKAQATFDRWLHKQVKETIGKIAAPLIRDFGKRHCFPTELCYRQMTTRWGSCTSRGKITFNSKLIHTPGRCIEYVVAHELCHLVHRNHGPGFYDLLSREMPDWEERKQLLNRYR